MSELSPEIRGAIAAINSMYEEIGQSHTALDMRVELLKMNLPAESPLLRHAELLGEMVDRLGERLARYREAAESGDFTISIFGSGSNNPCLSIHPLSIESLSQNQNPEE